MNNVDPWKNPITPSSTKPWPTVQLTSPYDTMGKDEILIEWQRLKEEVDKAKEREMEMRKYIVKRAFPQAKEGANTQELGNGYQLKAHVKFNYKLDPDLDKIRSVLNRIGQMGNEGPFIASRLVKWSADFLLTEYRKLCADDATDLQKAMLREINSVLTIDEAAPSLEIKAPPTKK